MAVSFGDFHKAEAQLQTLEKDSTNYKDNMLLFVMFIPFKLLWQICIQLGIIFAILQSIYKVYYSRHFNLYFDGILYYSIELMYLFDTITSYMHKYIKRLNKFALYTPRNLCILTADTVTLIPVYEFYYLIMPNIANQIIFYVRLKAILRLVHIFEFLIHQGHVTTVNHLVIVVICHMIIFIVISLVMSIGWANLSCLNNCTGPNWADSIKYFDIDPEAVYEWVVLNFTIMANVIMHNWAGFIRDHNSVETMQLIVCVLVGFIMHVMIETGHITNILLETLRRQFDYKLLLYKLNWILKDYKATVDVKKNVIAFYTILWRKRNGIVVKPEGFDLLPPSLEKEVMVDMFWEALKHSRLFQDLDLAIKKEISLVMRSEYLLPGDYLFKPGMKRNKMVYIVSGILQILSHEDDSSPIISLAAGTILGEICCFYDITSRSIIRSATDCDIQILHLDDLGRILVNYKKSTPLLHRKLRYRFNNAKELRNFAMRKVYSDKAGLNKSVTPINRIKKQWRKVYRINKMMLQKKKKEYDQKLYAGMDYTVHSEYLSLFVLSDAKQAQERYICLNADCPYVMDPKTNFRLLLHYIHLVVVTIQTLFIPYWVVFLQSSDSYLFLINILFDYIYWFDLYIQAITALSQNNIYIKKPSKIIYLRLKSICFIIDIFASIPYDLFVWLFNFDNIIVLYFKLPRVLKCYKILQFVKEKETSLKYNHLAMIVLKYSIAYGLIIYFCTCFMHLTFCFGNKCKNRTISQRPDMYIDFHPTLDCIIYNINIIMAMSFSPRTPLNVYEMITYTLFSIIGNFMYSFFVGELTATVIKLNESNFRFRDHLKLIHNFMVNNSIPQLFRHNAKDFISFQWFNNKNIQITPNKGNKGNTLEQDLIVNKICDGLKLLPVFFDCSDIMLKRMTPFCVLRVLPPGTLLVREGDKALYIYIITRGYCQMECLMPGDSENKVVRILQSGDSFPVVEAFHKVNSLNKISTITAVEVISLNCFPVEGVIRVNNEYHKVLKSVLAWHRKKYHTVLDNIEHMQPFEEVISTYNLKRRKGLLFESDIDDQEEIVVVSNIKKFGVFQYFIFNRTLDPSGRFFVSWEIFRSAVCLLHYFIYLFQETLLVGPMFSSLPNIMIFCKIIFIVDIYLRLHVQFYNENNILVSDAFETAMHYIKTSFTLDLMSVIPWTYFSNYYIKFGDEYSMILNIIKCSLHLLCILYRPLFGLMYVEKNSKGMLHYLASFFFFFVIAVGVAVIGTNNILQSTCTYYANNVSYVCSDGDNFISLSIFKGETRPSTVFIICLYSIVTRFSATYVGFSDYEMTNNAYESLVIIIIFWGFKMFVISAITGLTIGGNMLAVKFSNKLTNFHSFVNKELVVEETITEFVNHFEYIWKKTDGVNMKVFLDGIYEKLQLDIKQYLFLSTLSDCVLFRRFSSAVMRSFFQHFQVEFMRKDAYIIQCNDIQNYMYFVAKGEVDIWIADCNIRTLRRGGVFGSFAKSGQTRQTINAVAKVHVELLKINSNLFDMLIKPYPVLQTRIHNLRAVGAEYIEETEEGSQASAVILQSNIMSISHTISSMHMVIWACNKFLINLNRAISQEKGSYMTYLYYLYVHVSPLTSIMLLLLQFSVFEIIYLQIYCSIIDLLFICHMFFNFYLYYTDPESGVKVKDPSLIRKRYLKSLQFWVDLVGLLPISLILMLTGYSDDAVRNATLNRTIRFLHLVRHYNLSKKRLNLSHTLQWSYIFYLITFEITIMSLIWYKVACPQRICKYRVNIGPDVEIGEAVGNRAIVLSFLYTVNIFTSTGLRTVAPLTIPELIVSMCMSIASVVTIALMCGAFTSMLVVNGITVCDYRRKLFQVRTYAQDRRLSQILVTKTTDYLLALWRQRRGELLPDLIIEAPFYLRQKVMGEMYQHHLANHEVFSRTHIDFIRQLVVHFKVHLYLSQDTIVERGDVDKRMYFIHRGEIVEIDHDAGFERILFAGDSFGEAQGLYDVPHKMTYKANTAADILILPKSDWEHLLNWFPASRDLIFEGIPNTSEGSDDVEEEESSSESNRST